MDMPTLNDAQPLVAAERVARWRADFPILAQCVHGQPLAYLDNAATTQKPRAVIDAVSGFYGGYNANVHRGVHALSQRSTEAFEAARERVRVFLGASRAQEIVFVRGATEAVNLVAQSYVRPRLAAGDEILVTALEHHANFVPWQQLCRATGARLRVAPIDADGDLDYGALEGLLGVRTRLVAVTHVSNALGTVVDVRRVAACAHRAGVPVLVDGAQAVAHLPVDVDALDCDFYVFSGHKCFGPTGIGVLYGRADLLADMPPWQFGGDMVRSVGLHETEFQGAPARFEAGTPDIAGAIGLGAAIDYLATLDRAEMSWHARALLELATRGLMGIPGVRVVGTAANKSAVLSFVIEDVHPHDIGSILDRAGVAIRTGHHCAMPAMDHFGLPAGTARASFAFYNTLDEVQSFVAAVRAAREVFA